MLKDTVQKLDELAIKKKVENYLTSNLAALAEISDLFNNEEDWFCPCCDCPMGCCGQFNNVVHRIIMIKDNSKDIGEEWVEVILSMIF
jgi:hypothetical protein